MLAEWLRIVGSRKTPPLFEKWMYEGEVMLEEVQSDIVDISHTALGHFEELKKKELVLAARAMSQDEFNKLVAAQNMATFAELLASDGDGNGNGNGMDENDNIMFGSV